MLHPLAQIGWPVLDRFRIGDTFAISPHGLFIAIGFVVGAWLLGRIAPRWGVSHDDVQGVVFWSLIGAIVGRAALLRDRTPLAISTRSLGHVKIWEGGISLLGGIAGAVIVNVPRVRREGYRFFQVADPVAPALALGIAIGRIGDLIIADHLGKPTSWLLAWTYRGGHDRPTVLVPRGVLPGVAARAGISRRSRARVLGCSMRPDRLSPRVSGVHQTALYDLMSATALFVLLYVVLMRSPRREGILTLTFGLWYGVSRHRRGLAAHRQAVLRAHGQPVDRAHGRHDLCRDAGVVRAPPRPGSAQRRGIGAPERGVLRWADGV